VKKEVVLAFYYAKNLWREITEQYGLKVLQGSEAHSILPYHQ